MSTDLTAVSLFAGIGGFDLAMERAGVKVTAAVEIDSACRGVLRRHFPQAKVFNDVREVTGDQLRATGFVPGRGILCGGFPCQDLSVAGRRAGLGGARSGLFWHIMRLADELRPRWLLLENVPGLLSAVCACTGDEACVANGRADRCPGESHQVKGGTCPGGCLPAHGGGMGTVLGALGQRGYGFAYRVLDAQFFGVPQRRQRVFIAGCLGDWAAPAEVLLEPEGGQGDLAARGQARPGTARGTSGDPGTPRVTGTLTAGSLSEYDDNTARAGQLVAHTLTARERRGPDSDAVSGFIVDTVSTLQGGGRRGHRVDAEGAAGGHLVPVTAPTLRSHPRAATTAAGNVVPVALRGRDGGSTAEAGQPGDPAFTLRTPGGRGSHPMIAHTLTSGGADASEDGTGRGTPLVPVGVAATLTAGTAAGEGVRPPGRRQEDDVNLVAGPAAEAAVRRLTPRECERLQGFPDDWTRWLDDGTGQSDSARYRQCGNAVAVPVVEWIACRTVAVDQAAAAVSAA